jgi:hypothetical protein
MKRVQHLQKNLIKRAIRVVPGADNLSVWYGFGLRASTKVIGFTKIEHKDLGGFDPVGVETSLYSIFRLDFQERL